MNVEEVESTSRENSPRCSYSRGGYHRGEWVELLSDRRAASKRLGEAPWRPRPDRGVPVAMERDAALCRGPTPVALLRDEYVDVVSEIGYASDNRIDERRDSITRESRVRRSDGEDLQGRTRCQRRTSSTMRSVRSRSETRSSCCDVISSERRPSETNWTPTTMSRTPRVKSGRPPIP